MRASDMQVKSQSCMVSRYGQPLERWRAAQAAKAALDDAQEAARAATGCTAEQLAFNRAQTQVTHGVAMHARASDM